MSETYLGQVMMVGFNYAPRGFAFCNGQLLAIAQNQALFSLLGTYYGGNGTTTFALPDLRSRTPVGAASSANSDWQPPQPVTLGEASGAESVTLLTTNVPPHVHTVNASTTNGTTRNPNNAVYATTTSQLHAASSGPRVTLDARTVSTVGGNQPHTNVQPYLTINFCMALTGIYPSRN